MLKTAVVRGLLLTFLGSSLVLMGCGALLAGGAGAAAGGGAVAYVRGESQATYPASFDRTWGATLRALQDTNLKVTDTQRNGTQGAIKALQADETAVTINLEQAGPGTTAVKIRVGVFGDEESSKALHTRIASRLGVG
jgi:uncharacterized lipoprotein